VTKWCRARSPLIGLLFFISLTAAWPQSQLISIPIDPAKATLEMGRRRPDGTQFVLLVRTDGSPIIRYLAVREDAVRREADALSSLIKLNDAETQEGAVLRKSVQEQTAKVALLEESKTQLLDELSKAQASSVRARKRVKNSDTDKAKETDKGTETKSGLGAATPESSTTSTTAAAAKHNGAVQGGAADSTAKSGKPAASATADAALDRGLARFYYQHDPVIDKNSECPVGRLTPLTAEVYTGVMAGTVPGDPSVKSKRYRNRK